MTKSVNIINVWLSIKLQIKIIEVNQLSVLALNEVAKLLIVNTVELYHCIKRKELVSFSIGTRVYYKQEDILNSMKPINS